MPLLLCDVTSGTPLHGMGSVAENAARSLHKGDRVLVVGKLIQRTFEVDGRKRSTVEVQVQHVAPDLQFAIAEITKPSTGDSPTPAEQTA